jgi:hypothetical protein
MGLFKQIAEPLVARGVPVMPLRPRTKIAFIQNWPDVATTDLAQIERWDAELPDANGASVSLAKEGGVWFLDIDKEGFSDEIEKQTGQKIPETFTVRSSKGKGHYYFRQSPASMAMGIIKAVGSDGHELFSARSGNAYVVSPKSVHPDTGKIYEIIRDTDIIPAPDWLVQWCINQKPKEVFEKSVPVETKKIVSGSRNNAITSLLGRARQTSELNFEELLALGLRLNEERCEPPLSEQEVRTIANSVSKYSVTETPRPLIGGVPVGQLPSTAVVQAQPLERPEIKAIPYPVFPDPKWIFKDCSIFDGFVRPVCEANPSRRAEFMMLPALTILLNYIGTKVRIEFKGLIPSIYLVLVARKGRMFKSSSIQDAIEYLNHVGIVDYANQGTRNAEGKSLVWTAGSPEGLGMEMARTNCHSPILFYDELATLSKKTSIEGSSLGQALSTMYESGLFANTVKGRKEQFSHAPKSYCASLLAATTDKNFIQTMSPIITSAQGNDERFMYVYQPEILPKATPQVLVDTKPGSSLTRQRIDKAIKKGVYSIDGDMTRLEHLSEINNRVEQRAEKWALALAIDLGKDTIDDDVLERAYYIAKYELAVKKYLHIPESTTREASIQNEIIQLLQRNGGSVLVRDLNRVMHPERHGTSLWFQVYNGLIRGGWIAEDGDGTKGSPRQVILLRVPEVDD